MEYKYTTYHLPCYRKSHGDRQISYITIIKKQSKNYDNPLTYKIRTYAPKEPSLIWATRDTLNSARNQRTFTVSMYSYWYQALFYIVLTKFYYQTGLYGLW